MTAEEDELRWVNPDPVGDEGRIDQNLRPKGLEEFIGQTSTKENLRVFIDAAIGRDEHLDHVLLSGPPGLGKTTLASIIARELGVGMRPTTGPALERPGDVAAILSGLEPGDVLFIDEIHRLPRPVEEILYPAMEDFVIDIIVGKGPGARSIRIDVPRFTLIGATTRTGLLTSPLRDRFGVTARLDYYSAEELALIIRRSAGILGITIDEVASLELARRSRGTPRIANRLLRRVRDFAQVAGSDSVTQEIVGSALTQLEVDRLGLDKIDIRILSALIDKFEGEPVGLGTLATSLGEDPGSIEDVYEPYLLQLGLIRRTPRGRVPTGKAYEHMGSTSPVRIAKDAAAADQEPLF